MSTTRNHSEVRLSFFLVPFPLPPRSSRNLTETSIFQIRNLFAAAGVHLSAEDEDSVYGQSL